MNAPLPPPVPPAPDEGLLRDLLRDLESLRTNRLDEPRLDDPRINDPRINEPWMDEECDEEALVAEAARVAASDGSDAATRTLLVDVAHATMEAAGLESGAHDLRGVQGSRAVQAAALRAFDRFAAASIPTVRTRATSAARATGVPGAGMPSAGERSIAERPRRLVARPWAAAAVLLVAFGVVFAVRGGRAEAGVRIDAISRHDLSRGASSWEGGRTADVGEVFEAGPSSLVELSFPGDARVVLGEGDAARILASESSRRDGKTVGVVVLGLERGDASVAAGETPVHVRVGSQGVLEVERGSARVEATRSVPDSMVRQSMARQSMLREDLAADIAVAAGGAARFVRPDGRVVDLAGPTHVRVGTGEVERLGSPERSLFRDLEFFGGDLRREIEGTWTPAKAWRVVEGRARRTGGQVVGDPASAMTLAWQPGPEVRGARVLRLAVRGPAGTTVLLDGLRLDGLGHDGLGHDGHALGATLGEGASLTEPGLPTTEIRLPADWYDRLTEGGIRLTFRPPDARPANPRSSNHGRGERAAEETPKAKAPKEPASKSAAVVRFDGATLAFGDDRTTTTER